MLTATPAVLSATPVVAVVGVLLLLAVLTVFLMSFVLHRRSSRR
jgi:hypothetical protein